MNVHTDFFADPADYCRTCRGDKWAEDGARCDMCGGTGFKAVAVLPQSPAPMAGPELRAWRMENPRCVCGASDRLTMVSEGYHPEPPVYRCEAHLTTNGESLARVAWAQE